MINRWIVTQALLRIPCKYCCLRLCHLHHIYLPRSDYPHFISNLQISCCPDKANDNPKTKNESSCFVIKPYGNYIQTYVSHCQFIKSCLSYSRVIRRCCQHRQVILIKYLCGSFNAEQTIFSPKKIVSQWHHIATLQADILSRDAFLPVLEKCGVIVPAFCLFKEI